MKFQRPPRRRGSRPRLLIAVFVCTALCTASVVRAQTIEAVDAVPETGASAVSESALVVLPFRIHASHSYSHLTDTLAAQLSHDLSAMEGVRIVRSERVAAALGELGLPLGAEADYSDADLRRLGGRVGASAVLTGSVTELAGRFSLDVRLTPVVQGARIQTIVFVADDEAGLYARLDDVVDRLASSSVRGAPARIAAIAIEGAGPLEADLRRELDLRVGDTFDTVKLDSERARLEALPQVATVDAQTSRTGDEVTIRLQVLPVSALFGRASAGDAGEPVTVIEVRGNRRIEEGAIRARIRSEEGQPLRRPRVAADVQEIYDSGYFRDVRVFTESTDEGLILIFEVEEHPVVRQISISGNDSVDDDTIRDVLTLTTGTTLDYPLLQENVQRIAAVYRADGYYLAKVDYEIEEITEGSIAIHFEVTENEKLKLREIAFEGNEHFSDSELSEDFAIKEWKFWSPATSWFDKSGTYSEPIFMRDLQTVEQKYSDSGYLQVDVGQPKVDATEEGLFVTVPIREGPRFRVGALAVEGDDTMDLEALRQKLRLVEGEIFNRSFLTEDVEILEQHYTDRGFYFASVQPRTRLSEEDKTVDVQFAVEKGPLYFIRNVNISGNTRTIDPVIRREMAVVEGQLYSARALQVSTRRVESMGFFEDVSFEPKTTEDPSQLDLEVNVVERPTGSFSFGAGYSSQDKLVFTASLAQANLFGRGYGVNLSADLGGRTNRFFLSGSDPSFLDSDFSFGATIFVTEVRFDDFRQDQQGFDFNFGHALSEDNTSRGFLRYSFAKRKVKQNTGVNAAAPIFREILQGNESSSLVGLSLRRDTRNDRFAATSGTNSGLTVEYAGLGGFANFLRFEGRHSWYLGAPSWLIRNSTFVVGGKVGYAIPFNSVDDWDLIVSDVPGCAEPGQCINVDSLDQIDRDLKLPLTERYFLGGIGTFQLRGFKARSVGPRRAILRRSGLFGTGDLFHPVGTQIETDTVTGVRTAVCNDTETERGFFNQGNQNGRCNNLKDKRINDFDDIKETDVVGGNKFFSATGEYRFPISEEIGLQGVLFVDMGGAMAEGDSLFDTEEWRYGYGGGVLWFSPFGPLQLVLGFPVDPYSFEDSPVFEFSVGGFGL